MNNFKVEIYDNVNKEYIDYTKHAVFPLKTADMLDEQLDESEVTLKHVPLEYIYPMTLVRITFINTPSARYVDANNIINRSENEQVVITHSDNTKRITETLIRDYIVANDYSVEQPIGSGKYNHQLYLIEVTKVLEGYIGDSIAFTNPLGNDYVNENT